MYRLESVMRVEDRRPHMADDSMPANGNGGGSGLRESLLIPGDSQQGAATVTVTPGSAGDLMKRTVQVIMSDDADVTCGPQHLEHELAKHILVLRHYQQQQSSALPVAGVAGRVIAVDASKSLLESIRLVRKLPLSLIARWVPFTTTVLS